MQRNLIVLSHGRIWYAQEDFGLFTYIYFGLHIKIA